jgi:peptidoglycan-N-acetylglucosamine deacetylase
MTRWDWTWEDRSQATHTPTIAPAPVTDEHQTTPAPSGEEGSNASFGSGADHGAGRAGAGGRRRADQVFRRRRAGAGSALLVLVVLLIGLASSHKGSKHASATPAKSHVAKLSPSQAERAADAAKAEQQAINSVLAYTPFLRSGGSAGNEVALTFDDGPGPYTQQLVATLDKLKVQATFFAIGSQEQYFSAGTVAEINSGDVIGNHTETHPMMASLSPHDQYEQLFDQMVQIEVLGGTRPRLFRPPYGSFNTTTFREMHHLRLMMVLWSVDTRDYTLPGTAAIVQSALEGATPGAIILMHDGGGNRSETIAALPAIVQGLRKRGLRPVTIPRLLLDDPPPHGLPVPTSLAGD